ncbi:MAG: DUF4230 domain-containing protein [Cyclobacteriaceae bacterium]
MISLLRTTLFVLPWVLLIGILSWLLVEEKLTTDDTAPTQEVYQSSILIRVEQMGNLELVKYNFQEVTEIKKVAESMDFKFFKWKAQTDSKAVLISSGSAVGCIDLTRLKRSDISADGDTLYVTLPAPEMCFFKIDLEKSRIYDLQIDYLLKEDRAAFMEELYETAEANIKTTALEMGIIEQARENAQVLLRPLFEEISGKPVVLTFGMESKIFPDR